MSLKSLIAPWAKPSGYIGLLLDQRGRCVVYIQLTAQLSSAQLSSAQLSQLDKAISGVGCDMFNVSDIV